MKRILIIIFISLQYLALGQNSYWLEDETDELLAATCFSVSVDSLEEIILNDNTNLSILDGDRFTFLYRCAALALYHFHLETHKQFLLTNLNTRFIEPSNIIAKYEYEKIFIDNYIKGLLGDESAILGLDTLASLQFDNFNQKAKAIYYLAQAGRFDYWDYVTDQYINKRNFGMWNTYYFYSQDPRYRNEVLTHLIQEAESISSEEVLQVLSKANIVMTIDKSSGIEILKNRFYSTTGSLRLEYFRDLKSVDREGVLKRSTYGILNEPIDSIRKEYLPDPNRIHSYYFSEYLKPEFINFLLEQINVLDHSSETYVLASRYLQEFTPAIPDTTTPTNDLLNNLYNYIDSVYSYTWLGDLTFSTELKNILTIAKTNLQNGDSLACSVQVKSFQDLVDNVYKDSLNSDPRFVTIEGWKFLYWNAQYILDRLPEPPANPNLVVNLKNSLGNQIPASNVTYYEGSWKDAVNNGDGTFTVITTKPTVSIRIYYEYASKQADNVNAQNNTYSFTTVNSAVQLKNSLGNLIDAGTVQYYAGAWRSFGTTSNGVAYKELLPINYSFRMTYEFVSKDKQQNLSTNPIVDFNTVLCSVKVSKTSNNQAISNATVKYYAGAWRNLGTTNVDGITTKELLPANISFRATYGSVSLDKQQDISVNNLVGILLNIP